MQSNETMAKLALHWQILIGMLAGAAIGVGLNVGGGRSTVVIDEGLPAGVRTVSIEDSADHTTIRRHMADGTEKVFVITTAGEAPAGVEAAEVFESWPTFATAEPTLVKLYEARGRSPARVWGERFHRLGSLFLRLLKMVAVPLIITSLASGVLGLGGTTSLGRMFSRTLGYYFVTSLLAILTGLVVVNIVRPGLRGGGLPEDAAGAGEAAGPAAAGHAAGPAAGKGLGDVLFSQVEAMIPENPFAALVEPNFLSIIAFTIAFSIFAMLVGGEVAAAVRRAAETGFAVMMAMTTAIIRLAPVGVFFLVAYVTATQGLSVFRSLAWYMLAVAIALAVHAAVTLPAIVWLVSRRSPAAFAQAMSPALLTAFSSASSNGTLPLTLSCVEHRAGIRNRTASFVLPLGATINMDGTALYEAVAVLFIAQLHFGENLPLVQQVVVCVTALLASVGAAGIPHAGLVMMAIILQAVGLPAESQGIILAVDRVLDMMRTAVNVWSDSCGCAVVDAWEDRETVGTV
jgi:proton glutamate symport protein